MKTEHLLQQVSEQEVDYEVQQAALGVQASRCEASKRTDTYMQQPGHFVEAIFAAVTERPQTAIDMSVATYKLHRTLGVSRFNSLRHSSPSTGLAVAAIALSSYSNR